MQWLELHNHKGQLLVINLDRVNLYRPTTPANGEKEGGTVIYFSGEDGVDVRESFEEVDEMVQLKSWRRG